MRDKPYKKLIFSQRFLEGRVDGLVEIRSRILDDCGEPTNIEVYELYRPNAEYVTHEMRHGNERFDARDPGCMLEMNSWIGERIAA